MPDRVIRDEILKSDLILALKRNTHRLAFIACLLEADNLGNFEAGPGALWRLWRDWLNLTDRAQVAEILLALTDAGLVRLYDVAEKRYGHIPKFRQRLRYMHGKHPRPPTSIECHEINALLSKSQTTVRPQSDRSQTADGLQSAEVKRSEVKRRTTTSKDGAVPAPVQEMFPDAKTAMWEQGVRVLRAHGNSEQASRSLLGKLQKEHGVEKLALAIGYLSVHPAIEPKAYLVKMLREPTEEELRAKRAKEMYESARRSLI
jgi:hypothetical protein